MTLSMNLTHGVKVGKAMHGVKVNNLQSKSAAATSSGGGGTKLGLPTCQQLTVLGCLAHHHQI